MISLALPRPADRSTSSLVGWGSAVSPARTRRRERWHASRPARRIGRAGYWLELLVVLVVMAVAHRRLAPSSSASTSTVDRALPSMASQVRATTLGGYRHNVRAYLVPRLGDIPLQRLTTARVGAFYGELVVSGGKGGRPLSSKTVRYVHTTLRRALRDAVADGLVVRNVAAQARPPRARRVEMHTWTAEQVGAFLESVRQDRPYPAWLLLATLGMRRGELLGMRWVDVDLTSGRIAIRHTPGHGGRQTGLGRAQDSQGPSFPHPDSRGAGHVACSPRPSAGRAVVLGCRLHGLGPGHHYRGRPAIPPGDAFRPVRAPGQASRAAADPTP
jgi:hypothetical protein